MISNYVYWDGFCPPPLDNIIAFSLDKRCNMGFMDEEMRRTYTALNFPPKARDSKGQQVQQMNYNIFIHTMADVVRKYGPRLIN